MFLFLFFRQSDPPGRVKMWKCANFAMDSKRWWCLLSENYSILNLGEFFQSEKYRVYTICHRNHIASLDHNELNERWVIFPNSSKNTVNHHNLTNYKSLSEKTTILTPAIFSYQTGLIDRNTSDLPLTSFSCRRSICFASITSMGPNDISVIWFHTFLFENGVHLFGDFMIQT